MTHDTWLLLLFCLIFFVMVLHFAHIARYKVSPMFRIFWYWCYHPHSQDIEWSPICGIFAMDVQHKPFQWQINVKDFQHLVQYLGWCYEFMSIISVFSCLQFNLKNSKSVSFFFVKGLVLLRRFHPSFLFWKMFLCRCLTMWLLVHNIEYILGVLHLAGDLPSLLPS